MPFVITPKMPREYFLPYFFLRIGNIPLILIAAIFLIQLSYRLFWIRPSLLQARIQLSNSPLALLVFHLAPLLVRPNVLMHVLTDSRSASIQLHLQKEELDDERKFRKQSESLHRKLTRELCEAKHCLTKALKDLEKERKENLCDELGFKEKSRSHSRKGSDLRAQHEYDSANSMHQQVCLKELERRTRRDNKLQVMKSSVLNLSMLSEGDKIHPETSPKYVDDHHQILRKSETFPNILPWNVNVNVMVREGTRSRSLKDKLMEARVESRRLRSLKPESSPSHFVQA